MLIVAIAPSLIWPPKKTAGRPAGRTDSSATRPPVTEPTPPPVGPSARPPVRPFAESAETVWVTSPLYRLGFSTRGGQLVSAQLLEYQSFVPGDSAQRVQLVPAGRPFLVHRLVPTGGGDTVSLADWTFRASAPAVPVRGPATLRFEAERAGSREIGRAHVLTPVTSRSRM